MIPSRPVLGLWLTGSTLLLAACTGGSNGPAPSPTAPPPPSQPPATAFAVGTCRDLAPSVLSLGLDLRLLGEQGSPPRDVRDRVKTAQDALREVPAAPKPGVDDPLQQLVVNLGFLRLRSDSGTFTPDLATRALSSYDDLVAVCTAPPGSTPSGQPSAGPVEPSPSGSSGPAPSATG